MTTYSGRREGEHREGEGALWLRWVLANALAEAVGLGLTALAGVAIIGALAETDSVGATLLLAAGAILAGTTIEGSVVGTAQWLVLRGPLPAMRWSTWALATAAGACAAWTLGMVPSTVLSILYSGEGAGAGAGSGPAPAEPGTAVVLGLAFLMGLVLGPILGFAQWLALRRHVERAVLWMPANALAWAFGMVVVFAGATSIPATGLSPALAALLVADLALAGTVVGAIHGAALVWLLRSRGERKGSG